jgi:hypothetical protein
MNSCSMSELKCSIFTLNSILELVSFIVYWLIRRRLVDSYLYYLRSTLLQLFSFSFCAQSLIFCLVNITQFSFLDLSNQIKLCSHFYCEERVIVYFMIAMVAAGEVVEILESAAIQVLALSQAIDFDLVKVKWDLSVAYLAKLLLDPLSVRFYLL